MTSLPYPHPTALPAGRAAPNCPASRFPQTGFTSQIPYFPPTAPSFLRAQLRTFWFLLHLYEDVQLYHQKVLSVSDTPLPTSIHPRL